MIRINNVKLEHKREIHLEEELTANKITIDIGSGDINISGGKTQTAALDIIIYEKEPGDAEVYIENGKLKTRSKGDYPVYISRVTGTIPEDIAVDFDTGSGDISLKNMHSSERIILEAGSGDVSLSNCQAIDKIFIDTGSGDAFIDSLDNINDLAIDTGSGDIKIQNSETERVKFDTGSGDVKILSSKFEEVKADTGSGDIIFDNSSYTRGRFNTGSGEVIIR
jgi:DUF4097 and DUF4098 domain-containing protein YvlB